MKKYSTPTTEVLFGNRQDIICASRGVLVGDGANDIGNWYWALPGSTSKGLVEMSENRSIGGN